MRKEEVKGFRLNTERCGCDTMLCVCPVTIPSREIFRETVSHHKYKQSHRICQNLFPSVCSEMWWKVNKYIYSKAHDISIICYCIF